MDPIVPITLSQALDPLLTYGHQFVSTHPLVFGSISFGVGSVLGQPIRCAHFLFRGTMRTPFKGAFLYAWPIFSKWFDLFQAEIDKATEAASKSSPEIPPTEPPTASPPKA